MNIGNKGLAEVNLIIPQSTSLEFDVYHTDQDGNEIDHTNSQIAMVFQKKRTKENIDLSFCCTGTESSIHVNIPAEVTTDLDISTQYVWDMIVTLISGSSVRLTYGSVQIVDTYALDGA